LRRIKEIGGELSGSQIWSIPESNHHFAVIAAKEALDTQHPPQVILCMSDVIAIATMREILQRGLKIPEDIKVVGFDGIEEGLRFHPSLTTVEQYSSQKGVKAAELFLEGKKESAILPFVTEIRESSQPIN